MLFKGSAFVVFSAQTLATIIIMVKKTVQHFILSLTFVLLFSCSVDFTKKDTMNKYIYGEVIEKFRDEHNHMETTIVYQNKEGHFRYQVSDWAIRSDFWEYIQKGDSIIKPSGILTIRVKKPNGEFKDYEYQR